MKLTSRSKTFGYLAASFIVAQFCLSYSFVPGFITAFAWVHFLLASVYLINK